MGSIDHQYIDAGGDQRIYTVIGIGAGAHGGASPQLAVAVFRGKGKALRLVDVLDGDHAAEVKIAVNHQQFLNPVLV